MMILYHLIGISVNKRPNNSLTLNRMRPIFMRLSFSKWSSFASSSQCCYTGKR